MLGLGRERREEPPPPPFPRKKQKNNESHSECNEYIHTIGAIQNIVPQNSGAGTANTRTNGPHLTPRTISPVTTTLRSIVATAIDFSLWRLTAAVTLHENTHVRPRAAQRAYNLNFTPRHPLHDRD